MAYPGVWEGVFTFGKDLFRLEIFSVDTTVLLPGGRAAHPA